MSADYYYRCLSYRKGHVGIAKEGDLKLLLHTPPVMFPDAIEVEFGEVHRGVLAFGPYVQYDGQRRQEMEPPEIIAVRAWLSNILRGAMKYAKMPLVKKERRKGATP